MVNKIKTDSTDKADYDTPWKNILERFFEEFISFFFPKIHEGIDWDKGYEFFDKELLMRRKEKCHLSVV